MTTETVEAPTRQVDRCPTCGQRLSPPCPTCGVRTETKSGGSRHGAAITSHMSDHRANPDASGNCVECGLPTKERWGTVGHVFDHHAVIE